MSEQEKDPKKTAFVRVTETLVVPKPGWVKNETVTIMDVEVWDEFDAAEVALSQHRIDSHYLPSDEVTYGRTGKSYRVVEYSTGFIRYYKFEEF